MRLTAGLVFARYGRFRAGLACFIAAGLGLALSSLPASAGPGSGTAAISPSAAADSVAPATATFLVTSDPAQSGSPAPLASSPTLSVVPDSVTHVRVVDPGMTPVGVFTRSADEDTTRLYLLGYDRFDNPARL